MYPQIEAFLEVDVLRLAFRFASALEKPVNVERHA
jgi:hypothetical protein